MLKIKAGEYQLSSTLNDRGTVFSTQEGDDPLIVKKVIVEESKAYLHSCEKQLRQIEKIDKLIIPNRYYLDGKFVYFIYPKFNKSIREIIEENKARGTYIPMKQVKYILREFSSILKSLHQAKLSHGKVKTTNLFLHEGDYVMSDPEPFGVYEDESYQSPEYILKGSTKSDSDEDRQLRDIWSFGVCLLEVSTLMKPSQLTIFREPNTTNSTLAISLKEGIRKRYSKTFLNLIDQILQRNPSNRRSIAELQIDQFLDEENIDLEDEQFEPDVELIVREFKNKLKFAGTAISTYLEKYGMKPASCKMKASEFYEALEDLKLNLSQREKAAIEKKYDPLVTGTLDFKELISVNQDVGVRMKTLEQDDESALKEFQQDVLGFIQEKDIELQQEFSNLDLDKTFIVDIVDFENKLDSLGVNVSKEQIKLIKKKYDPQSKGLIHYMHFCQDVQISKRGGDQGIDEIMKQIYSELRSKFNTFSLFFKKYNQTQDNFLKYSELQSFLQDCNLNPANRVLIGIYKVLDPDERQEILYTNFRKAFESQVNNDVKVILIDIGSRLDEQEVSFVEFFNKNQSAIAKSKRLIKKDEIFAVLKSLGKKQSDIILYCFQVRKLVNRMFCFY